MLYIEDKRVTQPELKKYKEELKKVFPSSFGDNPIPVRINLVKGLVKYASVYRPNSTNDPVGTQKVITPPSISSGRAKFVEDGFTKHVVFTTTPPSHDKATGEFRYTKTGIELKDGLVIDPERDLEKLVYLYFFSPEFTNGNKPRQSGRYEFHIPAVQARATISGLALQAKYANEIINEDSSEYKDYTWIKAMYNMLALNSTNEEETDRLQLYDLVIKNESLRERYERSKLNIEATTTRSGVNKVNEMADIVKSLRKDKLLREEGGFWVLDANGTVKTLVDVNGTNVGEKQLYLIEWLQQNPLIEDELKALFVKE